MRTTSAPSVKPGGTLVYVVCSLLDAEGAGQAQRFLDAHPGWKAAQPDIHAGCERGPGLRLTPFKDSTDGFFVAKMTTP